MGKLTSKLRKGENNSLSEIFTKITRKYLEILFIEYIQRNRYCLQPRSPDDFRIHCKPL